MKKLILSIMLLVTLSVSSSAIATVANCSPGENAPKLNIHNYNCPIDSSISSSDPDICPLDNAKIFGSKLSVICAYDIIYNYYCQKGGSGNFNIDSGSYTCKQQ